MYDIWIYKVFILWKLCRKCCFWIPTFKPRGVVYLPTNWPLTSPPGPLSLSGTRSSLLPSPSDSPDPRGRGREPPSTTEVKSLGWNRFSCCNFSGFWDSVAENNSFWSLNRIHTSWSYSMHAYSFYIFIIRHFSYFFQYMYMYYNFLFLDKKIMIAKIMLIDNFMYLQACDVCKSWK